MTIDKGGTAGTDQSNSNAGSRNPDRLSKIIASQANTALEFANTSKGRTILGGIAATVAGLLLSRDQRVRTTLAGSGEALRNKAEQLGKAALGAAEGAVGSVRTKSGAKASDQDTDQNLDQMLDTIHVVTDR